LIPDFNEKNWQSDEKFSQDRSLGASGVVKLRENFRKSAENSPEPKHIKNDNKKETERD
jgi:hypothetical protein